MANTFVAVFEASDPHDLAPCPNPLVKLNLLSYGCVRLISESYDDLMDVLVNFVGFRPGEADVLIEELV